MAEPDPMMEARRAYEDSSEPVKAIAARLGVSPETLSRRAKKLGWRLRPPQTLEQRLANLERGRAAARRARSAPDRPTSSDRLGLVQKLRATVEREIAGVEKRLKQNAGGDGIERAARTLASLVRTLRELRALEAEAEPDQAEDVPRDADELRRALAERLDRLGRERDG